MADKRLSNIQGGWSSAGVVMGDSVFLHLAGGLGVKFGERDGSSEIEKSSVWSLYVCVST